MTATINIPTASELADTLGGLDKLLTAKRWEKAAIVWAFTTNDNVGGQPGLTALEVVQFPCNIREFTRQKFSGLGSQDTVRYYRKAWQTAIDEGKAQPVTPGQVGVEAPDMEWPPSLRTQSRKNQPHAAELIAEADEAGISSTTVLDAASNKDAVVAAIKGDPDLAMAIAGDDDAEKILQKARVDFLKGIYVITPRKGHEQFKGFLALMSRFNTLDSTLRKIIETLRDLPLDQTQPAFMGKAEHAEALTAKLLGILTGDQEFDDELEALLAAEAEK